MEAKPTSSLSAHAVEVIDWSYGIAFHKGLTIVTGRDTTSAARVCQSPHSNCNLLQPRGNPGCWRGSGGNTQPSLTGQACMAGQ
jgi:hypothetical protein